MRWPFAGWSRKPYRRSSGSRDTSGALPATAFCIAVTFVAGATSPPAAARDLTRLVVSAMAVVALMGGASRAVVSALPLDLGAWAGQGPLAQLEIRLAEAMPVAGLTAATVDGTSQAIYVRTALVTGRRRAGARAGCGRWALLCGRHVPRRASQRMSRAGRARRQAGGDLARPACWPRRSSAARSGAARS
jgi:hypothetical protein